MAKIATIISLLIPIFALIIAFFTFKVFFKLFNQNMFVELSKEQVKRYIKNKDNNKYLQKMSKNGYMSKHGFDTEPSTYILQKIGTMVLIAFTVLTFTHNAAFMIIGAFIGYNLVDIAYHFQNKIDNNEMADDIRNLRDTLIIHAEAGVPLIDTIATCLKESENKRFKQALNEMFNYISSSKLTIKEAIRVFESRFNNKQISAICVIIDQAEETSQSATMLTTLIDTATTEQEAENYKKEKSLERKMLLVCLLYFAFILANVFYSIAQAMGNSVSVF